MHFPLRDSCTIARYTTAAEVYASKRTAATLKEDVPCLIIIRGQKGFSSITGQWLTTTLYKLLFLHSEDIVEGDRISKLVYDDGTEITNNFEVEGGVILFRARETRMKVAGLKLVN